MNLQKFAFAPIKLENNSEEVKVEPNLEKFAFEPAKLSKRPLKVKKEEDDGPPEKKQLKWEPLLWRETMANIREMRLKFPAPVDTMGCEKCADDNVDDKTRRYHCLLSLMLSSQTKDQITFDAMNRLKARVVPLVPREVLKIADPELEDLLKPVSFFRVKAKHIKATSQMLIDQFDSDIPDSIEGLLKLPGVGKKMAYLAMNSAWNKIEGIGVDTHVHRISNWLKWVPKPTKTPEETRVALEKWLPHELWDEVNLMMVGFGQTTCAAVRPKCEICVNAPICPACQLPKGKSPRKKK